MSGLKEAIDVIGGLMAIAGIPSAIVGYLVHRQLRKAAGEKALGQINDMATNHFPHMQADLASLNKKQEEANNHSEKILEVLQNMDKGISILVDRQR